MTVDANDEGARASTLSSPRVRDLVGSYSLFNHTRTVNATLYCPTHLSSRASYLRSHSRHAFSTISCTISGWSMNG